MTELLNFVFDGALTDIDKVFCLVLFFMIFEMLFTLMAELMKMGMNWKC